MLAGLIALDTTSEVAILSVPLSSTVAAVFVPVRVHVAPASTTSVWKPIEGGAYSADRAGAAATSELQCVRAAAVCRDVADEHRTGIDEEAIGATGREIDGVAAAGYRAGVCHRTASRRKDTERS